MARVPEGTNLVIFLLVLCGIKETAVSIVSGIAYIIGKMPTYGGERYALSILCFGAALGLIMLRDMRNDQ